METPTDRTVDDHIYRLRKKLKKWEGIVSIPPFYRMYNHFIEGDIEWFLATDEMHKVLYYVKNHLEDEPFYRKYAFIWTDMAKKYDFAGPKEKIERKLESFLFGQ